MPQSKQQTAPQATACLSQDFGNVFFQQVRLRCLVLSGCGLRRSLELLESPPDGLLFFLEPLVFFQQPDRLLQRGPSSC